MRSRYRTNSKELIALIRDSGYSSLSFSIANGAIHKCMDMIDNDEEKLDNFRNHRCLRHDDVMSVYVSACFDEIGNSLPGKYVVDYD